MIVDVGVTATRRGLTDAQLRSVEQGLADLRDVAEGDPLILHHGDCVGGDAQVHGIARGLGYWIIGHPPVDPRYRAHCDCDHWMDPLPYLERNHLIVLRSRTILCLPGGVTEQWRGSGTWATIRYAAQLPREGCLVYPDGTILGLDDWLRTR